MFKNEQLNIIFFLLTFVAVTAYVLYAFVACVEVGTSLGYLGAGVPLCVNAAGAYCNELGIKSQQRKLAVRGETAKRAAQRWHRYIARRLEDKLDGNMSVAKAVAMWERGVRNAKWEEKHYDGVDSIVGEGLGDGIQLPSDSPACGETPCQGMRIVDASWFEDEELAT